MKYVKTFESFLFESDVDPKVEAIKKRLKGDENLRTILNMYRFYFGDQRKGMKDSELISKAEHYDQEIRLNDKLFNSIQQVGINPRNIDKINLDIVLPFFTQVKPGTDEFEKVWLIVQHADDNIAAQKKFLELHNKDMSGKNKVYLEDRIATNEGKPQKGLSQGMEVELNGKKGWLPWQSANLKIQKETIKAKETLNGKEIELLKWERGEDSKVSDMIKLNIGPANVKRAEEAGMEINLKNYVEQVMNTEYLGPYMIKK